MHICVNCNIKKRKKIGKSIKTALKYGKKTKYKFAPKPDPNHQIYKDFHDAIQTGNDSVMKKMYKDGLLDKIDLNSLYSHPDCPGFTNQPLMHFAIDKCLHIKGDVQWELYDLLMYKNTKHDSVDANGKTILAKAISSGVDSKIINKMVDFWAFKIPGADIKDLIIYANHLDVLTHLKKGDS